MIDALFDLLGSFYQSGDLTQAGDLVELTDGGIGCPFYFKKRRLQVKGRLVSGRKAPDEVFVPIISRSCLHRS